MKTVKVGQTIKGLPTTKLYRRKSDGAVVIRGNTVYNGTDEHYFARKGLKISEFEVVGVVSVVDDIGSGY